MQIAEFLRKILCRFLAQGQQGNGNPCGPEKLTCHSKASCVNDLGTEQCRCNDGYQGDGTKCEGMDMVRYDIILLDNTTFPF